MVIKGLIFLNMLLYLQEEGKHWNKKMTKGVHKHGRKRNFKWLMQK